ncbi:hypothetical protein PHYSODRAFT_255926 [Phytophthora sojae]|uniref:beta-glucosidase n=1 Tax=Phytophthora sojae (strain P6497) TaxID=1094619 RepID=G5A8D8_PHYSP|nr:hypothetical protein PHYSODRAFT_255926 [Phytophthora sojae]EGZ08164.1 hypothetical protein PHYSODRAFT_255926 [Phytophthora sojae]|eukprot:XP_009536336.1 hypothetical protein PHYSODRAFT_255926 [Phytophthora sojae]
MTSKAEYTIVVIGEETYAEKPGNINDQALPEGQVEYIKELASTGTNVIVVLFEGRPRLLGEIPEKRLRGVERYSGFYTDFTYSEVRLSRSVVETSTEEVVATVDVTNSGSMAGKETVVLFLIQPYRSLNVPEVKQLKKFNKISLEPGQTQTVNFTLTSDDRSVYYPRPQEGGGGLRLRRQLRRVHETTAVNPLCATFTLGTGEYPFGTFEQPW